jgi:hypothetical protein
VRTSGSIVRLIPICLVLLASACSPKIIKETVVVEKSVARVVEKQVEVTKVVEKQVAVTAAPAGAQQARADATPIAATAGGVSDVAPQQTGKMIIKNGEMALLVADTTRALNDITRIAADNGGYIIASETKLVDEFKYATLYLGVPVDRFERVQEQIRGLAIKINKDNATGEDVSDLYVGLRSRLTNLEATEARIRQFLDQAKTVEEALKVNAQLTEIEDEIEKVKGRMNYLKDRAAYSTLTVDLEPQRPTPTVTPTVTPTATPTATTTPTPSVWQPGRTVDRATGVLATIAQFLGDAVISVVIVVGPFAAVAVLLYLLVRAGVRRRRPPTAPKLVP